MVLVNSMQLVNDIDGLISNGEILKERESHWRDFFEACREEKEKECSGTIHELTWEGICEKAVRVIDMVFLRQKASYRLNSLYRATNSELFAHRLVAHEEFSIWLEKNLYVSGTYEDVLQFFESTEEDNIK